MQCFAVVTLFIIASVRGYPSSGNDDITKAIHDLYPPPLNQETVSKSTTSIRPTVEGSITFPKDVLDAVFNSPPNRDASSPLNIMKSSKMKDATQNHTDIPDFFKQLLSNITQMQLNKNISNSKHEENNTQIYLDPKVLENLFNTNPEVQQLMANATDNGTNFDTDIRFLTESLLKGAFHNSVEDSGVKLRSVLIPPDQSSPVMGRSAPIDIPLHDKPTNGASKYVPSFSILLVLVWRLFAW